jgi:hypothetical protein
VDVVVLVLADVRAEVGGRSLGRANVLLVLEGGSLLVELGLVLGEHVLLVLSDNGGSGRLDVLGGEDLVVLNRLDSVLVVLDVSFSVDGLGSLDVLLRSDVLLDDLRGDLGADLRESAR